MTKLPIKKYRGFTLIEMLVVVSIIGILAAIGTISFTSSQKQARDTQRKSDLKQYQSSLESFANKNDWLYPMWASASSPNFNSLCSVLGITTSCPFDPKYNETVPDPVFPQYGYQTDGSLNNFGATATKYILWAKLENASKYWIICSSGSVFSNDSKPTIATCQ